MNKSLTLLVLLLALLFFSATVNARTIPLNTSLNCLAAAIYFESRGEILSAQVSVAQLVMTRTRSAAYSDSVCDVIKEKGYSQSKQVWVCAFEWYCSKSVVMDFRKKQERFAWNRALVVASSFLSSSPPKIAGLEKATLFHDISETPWWAKMPNVKLLAAVGNLRFYKEYRNGRLVASL